MPQTHKITHHDLVVETFPIGSFACNCTLIYSEKTREAIIIDPGNDKETLLSMINERQLKVKKLLHSHAHFDHIGMAGEVHKCTGASIHLHPGDFGLYKYLPEQAMMFGGHIVGEVVEIHDPLIDEQTFGLEESDQSDFLKTLYTPGHTEGSCCFYSEATPIPILFAGDTLFKRSIGRTDLPGGNTDKILSSIKDRLLTLPEDTLVITGHGPSTYIHEEKRQNPFVS